LDKIKDDTYKQRALAEYVASKIMEDLRSGKTISPELVPDIHKRPFIDELRKQVQLDDKRFIFELISSTHQNIVIFGIGLMMPIRNDPDVKKFLFDLWGSTDNTQLKSRLTHRLMDYELAMNQHEDIRRFVKENWKLWLAQVKKYYDGPEDYLDKLKQALGDKGFPKTKLWMRLYQSMVHEDKKAVRQFLEGYTQSDAPLAAEVASELIRNIKKGL
jgi:hypothetical protein